MTKLNAARAATHFGAITDPNGRFIHYIYGNEGTGLCLVSVLDPASDAPAKRIVDGREEGISEEEMPGSGKGLTVYGRHKWSRPHISAAVSIDRSAVAAVIDECVRHGIAYEEAMVCEAVRKRLGLSQAEIGLALDMAAGNSDPDKRRQNVGRSIRRYETDGAPKVYADALRWMAWQNGILVAPPAAA